MKKSNKQIILEIFNKQGYVDNYYCIDKRITTRLGAVMHLLKEDGLVFETAFGKDLFPPFTPEFHKNFYYYKPGHFKNK